MAEHMSPRRSPRLKVKRDKYRVDGPELPPKPRRPKRVKNAAETFDDEPDSFTKFFREGGYAYDDSPDKFFMDNVEWRALYLWQGEQVDGSTFKDNGQDALLWPGVKIIINKRNAVMAGYRYLVSFRSTPRRMRVNGYVRP